MYNLHQLGWYSFQKLATTIAREVFGQTTMTFMGSGDGGRDGSFSGTWQQNKGKELSGEFVFQCKFTNDIKLKMSYSQLTEELPKVSKLVDKGLCDIYVIMTNAKFSFKTSEKLEQAFKTCGVKHVLIFGADWISDTIKENKRLRRMVPRLYGLGDLSQILDERVYLQGRTLLQSLKDDLSKVVITNAYRKAAESLEEHGFVLLVGEPAAGKTTIAALLAMGALDQWQTPILKLKTAEQMIGHWNPDDPDQFFWLDDVFGVTQYEPPLVQNWNHHIMQIKTMIKNGVKIVLTSRDYIYNRARQELKEGSFPILNERQVVIDVHDLSSEEKKMMLYNHIKLGDQKAKFLKDIKPHLEFISSLSSFIPETARRLGSSFFTRNLGMHEYYIEEFVSKQESFLVDVISGLDKDSLSALALIYMNSDNLPSPLDLKAHESTAINRIGGTLGGSTDALKAMKGNLVQYVHVEDEPIWKFRHPTVADAFAVFVVQSPELIEIYLYGSTTEKLFSQVTCGDVGVEKAIIVPKRFFPMMLDRLKEFKRTSIYKSEEYSEWGAKRRLQTFLYSRCSKEFLKQYIDESPEILNKVANPGLYLNSATEVNLAIKFFDLGLFPEAQRLIFVKKVSSYAVNGKDVLALKSKSIRKLFTDEEYESLKRQVADNLMPNLADLTEKYTDDFDRSEEPADYVDQLKQIFDTLEEVYGENEEYRELIENEIAVIDDWVSENSKAEPTIRSREKLSDDSISVKGDELRSIFDDIDV